MHMLYNRQVRRYKGRVAYKLYAGCSLQSILRHGQHIDPSSHGYPSAPAIIGGGLPVMPCSSVASSCEYFYPPVLILIGGEDINPSPQGFPSAPTVIGSRLPDMPYGAIRSSRKHFQSSVRIVRGNHSVNPTS